MSDPGTTVIQIDDKTHITVSPDVGRSLVFLMVDTDYDDAYVLATSAEAANDLVRAIASAIVVIKPPTILAKPIRNPRQPNVPDNADALARVAMSTPERIDGEEK